jgi:two-component system KDP operon response regulator KdpE
LQASFDAEQYCLRWVPTASQALGLDLRPNVVILELPSSGGTRNLARLKRRFPVPVLALTQGDHRRSGTPQGTSEGVEASLARPFRMAQLVQLVHVTLMASAPGILRAPGMSLDTKTRRLQVNRTLYQLPPIGCRIMAVLMARFGSVVSREDLFRDVWHTEHRDSSRALDVHIAGLRRLLEPDPRHPKLIVTERRVGYWFRPPAQVP